jgi:hypothetical protein
MVDLFLSYFVPLTLASGFLIIKLLMGDQRMLKPMLLVGVGWIVCFVFWLVMIALVRSCILKTVARVRDPVAFSALDQASLKKRRLTFS